MKRHWLIMAAFLLLASVGATTAKANHLLAMTMSWEPTSTTREIKFTMTVYFRISALVNDGQISANPAVGDKFCEGAGGMSIDFGDGSTPTGPLCFIVTNVDAANDIIRTEALQTSSASTPGVFHTYGGSTSSFLATASGCCRSNTTVLNNRASNSTNDEPFVMLTHVTFDGNKSPVSTTGLPILTVCEAPHALASTFTVSATDPNSPADAITYRIASNTEATGLSGSAHDGPPSESGQSPMTINSSTGVVSWYNHGLASPRYYTMQVIAEDHDGSGNVKTQTAIDFLLKVVPDNTAPTFDLSISPSTCSDPCGHSLVTVNATIANLVDGGCLGSATVKLVSITSNQNDEGLGSGDVANDIQGADFNSDDREFQLRCEAIGNPNPRVYTITYTATDPAGNSTNHTATFTVNQVTTHPTITVGLTPSSCSNPCGHDLVNVGANITVSNATAPYSVQLVSIASNQLELGLGCGDVPDDIQGESTTNDDRAFQLRCEAINGNRTYTVTYRVTDACGGTSDGTATFNVTAPPATAPAFTLSLSPNTCNDPCGHSLVNVTANLNVTACGAYTVELTSIGSNQNQSGLGSGDVAVDIVGAMVGSDDRNFQLRCEAIGGTRTYTATYKVTDACGRSTSHSATFTVQPGTPSTPTVTVSLSPNSCNNPCDHDLVTVNATVNVSNCQPGYTVTLCSITSNQAESGLGYGDEADDIQYESIGTADYSFKLRCEAIGGTRTYTVTYCVTDPCGSTTSKSATFTVQPPSPPTVTLSLSPNSCNSPCDHDLVNVHAYLNVSNCQSGYTVKLCSITSNQAESGLGYGDVSNDIQNETLNTDDRDFKLRCEAIGGTRTYTVTYCITDPCGANTSKTATFTVQPPSPPNVTLTLSPDDCSSACTHSLVNVHANLNVSNCQSGYTVSLCSITSNQAQSGLGSGDVADDIQNETLNTDDRDFKLRCEAIGGTRTYTVTYCITDPCGANTSKTATFTVTSGPSIHVSLSPNSCNDACDHDLVSVCANVDVNVCTSSYSIQLLSITSSQAQSGLGSGDESDDIQNESLNTNDYNFKLRCEAINHDRTYTVIYKVTDGNGATARDTAYFHVDEAEDCNSSCHGWWGWHKQTAETGDLSSSIMLELEQNHPNPFTSVTDFDYALSKSSYVNIEIIDMQGERVRTLFSGHQDAGTHTAQWDGTNDQGKPVKSGGYIYRIVDPSSGVTQSKQMILMR